MASGGSLRLLTLFGIRIGVSGSWFIVLSLLLALFTQSFQDSLSLGTSGAFAVAMVAVMLFFGSILLHEIGHALAARREGIEVIGIDLFIFGGVMRMRREGGTAGVVFRIAAAGPAVTLGIVVVGGAIAAGLLGFEGAADAAFLQARTGTTAVEQLVSLVVALNVVLLAFNLLPALPLDGGQMLRAAVWQFSGSPAKGTRVAAVLGQGLGVLLAISGVWRLSNGDTFGGVWAIGIGYMIGSGARESAVQGATLERLADVHVTDVMDADPVTIPGDLPADRAYEDFFLRYQGWEWFAVREPATGRFAGIVTREPMREASEATPPLATAAELATEREAMQIPASDPIERLLGVEALGRLGALAAVDADGRLLGIVPVEAVSRVLRERLSPAA